MTDALTVGTVPLSGHQYEISAGPYRTVVTGLGAGLRTVEFDGSPVLSGYDADELPPGGAGQLLAPWPNRIDGGNYSFDGSSYQLALNEPARSTAIHGLTRWANWDPVSQSDDAVELICEAHGQQGYPFSVELSARYALSAETGLTVTITARNRGTHAAPYGLGFHPYLTVGTPTVDTVTLTLPAAQWLPLDSRGIPSGPLESVAGTEYDFQAGRLVGDTSLDNALGGLVRSAEDGRAWAHLSAGGRRVSMWAGAGFDWLQVFTGDSLGPDHRRKAIAIEPMTCPPNAFVTGHDLIVLQPGDEAARTWGLTAE